MMKTIAALALLLMPIDAMAASAEDPVKAVMDIAVSRWQENSSPDDYFEKDHLALYGKALLAAYHAAEKYPAYDGGTSPFDYDVITSSQDGCPLKDLAVTESKSAEALTTVDVSFRLMDCAENAEDRARVSKLRFDVTTEEGTPVISDIHRLTDGKWDSLLAELREIAKVGAETESTPQ